MKHISEILVQVQKGLTLNEDDQYTDEGRAEWLDAFTTAKVGTKWERDFADGLYGKRSFSIKQREIIDRMAMQYMKDVNY